MLAGFGSWVVELTVAVKLAPLANPAGTEKVLETLKLAPESSKPMLQGKAPVHPPLLEVKVGGLAEPETAPLRTTPLAAPGPA